ncbi:MAG: Cytochrome c553i, partial [uncultured Acetobacteraceae bacterium]
GHQTSRRRCRRPVRRARRAAALRRVRGGGEALQGRERARGPRNLQRLSPVWQLVPPVPRAGRGGQLLRAELGRVAQAPDARAVQRDGHQRPPERHAVATERHAVLRPRRGRRALHQRHLRLPEGPLRRRARPRPAAAAGQL